MQGMQTLDIRVAGSAHAFLERRETQGDGSSVWVRVCGYHLVKLWIRFTSANEKTRISTFVLCSKRNILTWKKGIPRSNFYSPLAVAQAGCTFSSLSASTDASLPPRSSLNLTLPLRSSSRSEFPLSLASLACTQGCMYYHYLHHLWFTFGAEAVAFLSQDSFKNGIEPPLHKMV